MIFPLGIIIPLSINAVAVAVVIAIHDVFFIVFEGREVAITINITITVTAMPTVVFIIITIDIDFLP